MGFFKRLFRKEEEVSLKPVIGKKSPEKPKVREQIEKTPTIQPFHFPDIPKIKMTELTQVLRNLAAEKAKKEKRI